MPVNTHEIIDGLWKNARNSIAHALEHFSDRETPNSDRAHHNKWIVLSVHHAAECICNMRLLQIEPTSPLFVLQNPMRFPSLSKTLKRLQAPQNLARSSPAEHHLFRSLHQLSDIRHQLMHRTAPEKLDVSVAAICMIGLLKYIEHHKGIATSDIIWQSPPIEGAVVAAIRSTRVPEYETFVQLFLREKYGDRPLPECPSCGLAAVSSSCCEACFEELDYVRCPSEAESGSRRASRNCRYPADGRWSANARQRTRGAQEKRVSANGKQRTVKGREK
jgi:hypothetical protein